MILHLAGRLVRLELLPRPVVVRRRWDGTDQAHPVTFSAVMRRAAQQMAASMAALAEALR
jgi:hypothetical protein